MFKKIKEFFSGVINKLGGTRNPQRDRANTHASPQFDSDAWKLHSQGNERGSNISADLEKLISSDKSLSNQEKNERRYSQAPSDLKKKFKNKKPRKKSTGSKMSV